MKIELPAMGEGITSATISKWLVNVGDSIEDEDPVVEVATDKVDSEVVAPATGTITQVFFNEGDEVNVGEVIAEMQAENEADNPEDTAAPPPAGDAKSAAVATAPAESHPATADTAPAAVDTSAAQLPAKTPNGNFLSPLVRSIAEKEGITVQELDTLPGTGLHGRLTKEDVLHYLAHGRQATNQQAVETPVAAPAAPSAQAAAETAQPPAPAAPHEEVEVIPMDRMRKLIAEHMVASKQTSPHVTSFVEIDVTPLVDWRNKHKKAFQEKYDEKLTFTPIFIEAAVKALRDYPRVNVSVQGDNILLKKKIHIGMATALPNGNLIVPVIKDSDTKNLLGLARSVNDLASRARENKLKPHEIQGGTFTITNLGAFNNISGTPIINQPEAAILAVGAIKKRPAVIETPQGDTIGIRHIMIASMSYDHRVVDGALGGMYLDRFAQYLEQFDTSQTV